MLFDGLGKKTVPPAEKSEEQQLGPPHQVKAIRRVKQEVVAKISAFV